MLMGIELQVYGQAHQMSKSAHPYEAAAPLALLELDPASWSN